jgi:hypothetical protein
VTVLDITDRDLGEVGSEAGAVRGMARLDPACARSAMQRREPQEVDA